MPDEDRIGKLEADLASVVQKVDALSAVIALAMAQQIQQQLLNNPEAAQALTAQLNGQRNGAD